MDGFVYVFVVGASPWGNSIYFISCVCRTYTYVHVHILHNNTGKCKVKYE
jgi:hypothetical protein